MKDQHRTRETMSRGTSDSSQKDSTSKRKFIKQSIELNEKTVEEVAPPIKEEVQAAPAPVDEVSFDGWMTRIDFAINQGADAIEVPNWVLNRLMGQEFKSDYLHYKTIKIFNEGKMSQYND